MGHRLGLHAGVPLGDGVILGVLEGVVELVAVEVGVGVLDSDVEGVLEAEAPGEREGVGVAVLELVDEALVVVDGVWVEEGVTEGVGVAVGVGQMVMFRGLKHIPPGRQMSSVQMSPSEQSMGVVTLTQVPQSQTPVKHPVESKQTPPYMGSCLAPSTGSQVSIVHWLLSSTSRAGPAVQTPIVWVRLP